jgi:hypothetical protein
MDLIALIRMDILGDIVTTSVQNSQIIETAKVAANQDLVAFNFMVASFYSRIGA